MEEANTNAQSAKQTEQERINQEYNEYIQGVTPTAPLWKNMLFAGISGGLVCVFAQFCTNMIMNYGASKDAAAAWTLVILILLTGLFTGLGLFAKAVKWAGAGLLVPITGFANGIASPAIEFKKEGQVFGIGCKIFTIAGPVILYGLLTSWILGIIYWIGMMIGIV